MKPGAVVVVAYQQKSLGNDVDLNPVHLDYPSVVTAEYASRNFPGLITGRHRNRDEVGVLALGRETLTPPPLSFSLRLSTERSHKLQRCP